MYVTDIWLLELTDAISKVKSTGDRKVCHLFCDQVHITVITFS